MKFSVTTLVLGLVSAVLGQETLTINTPTAAYYCEPLLITWAGGDPTTWVHLPYLDYRDTLSEEIPRFPATSFSQRTFLAILDAYRLSDTPIALVVQDSTGATAESATFTVEYGSKGANGPSSFHNVKLKLNLFTSLFVSDVNSHTTNLKVTALGELNVLL
ncbi:hypothetical protein EDD17DRAFT_1835183 [Pisolithus thermaeus]|nr:hypothetical protein EDD17DRAFT_1835183 [Pisolithus thermaeus]